MINPNIKADGKTKVISHLTWVLVSYLYETFPQIQQISDIYLKDNKDMNPPNKVGYKNVNKYINVVVMALLFGITILTIIPII